MKVWLTRIHTNIFNIKWLILLCFFKRRYISLLYENLKFTNNHHSHKSHKESIFEWWRVHIYQGGYQISMLVLRVVAGVPCFYFPTRYLLNLIYFSSRLNYEKYKNQKYPGYQSGYLMQNWTTLHIFSFTHRKHLSRVSMICAS